MCVKAIVIIAVERLDADSMARIVQRVGDRVVVDLHEEIRHFQIHSCAVLATVPLQFADSTNLVLGDVRSEQERRVTGLQLITQITSACRTYAYARIHGP